MEVVCCFRRSLEDLQIVIRLDPDGRHRLPLAVIPVPSWCTQDSPEIQHSPLLVSRGGLGDFVVVGICRGGGGGRGAVDTFIVIKSIRGDIFKQRHCLKMIMTIQDNLAVDLVCS